MTETQKQEIALNSSIQMLHHDELPPAPAAHVGCWGWPPRCWDTSAPNLPPALGTLRLRARGSLSGRNKLSWGRCSGADLHHLSCNHRSWGGPFPVQIIFDESCWTLEANKFNKCQQIPIYLLVRAKDCKKTRRRMARERRGAGSSLVSMETQF